MAKNTEKYRKIYIGSFQKDYLNLMLNIILDTNFLLLPIQSKIDIFNELNNIVYNRYQICIIKNIIDELNKISKEEKNNDKKAAKFALMLLKSKKVKIIKRESNKNTDDLLFELAKKEKFIIATQDKNLRERLTQEGLPSLGIRQNRVIWYNKPKQGV